jgi:hypothetical protein
MVSVGDLLGIFCKFIRLEELKLIVLGPKGSDQEVLIHTTLSSLPLLQRLTLMIYCTIISILKLNAEDADSEVLS